MVASPPPPPPPPPPPGPYNPQNPHRMEYGGHTVQAETPGLALILKLLNGGTHFLLGAVAFSGFYHATSMLGSFSIGDWVIVVYPASYSTHIFLNVTGYIILTIQAMLVYNPFGGCTTSLQYNHKRILHLGLQIVGSFLAIVGSIVKLIDDDPNFYSAHSVMGFIALLLTVITLIGGIVNFVCCQRSEVLTWKLLHTCLGALTVTMAFMAMIAAYIIYFPEDALSISISILALTGFLLISAVYLIFRKHF